MKTTNKIYPWRIKKNAYRKMAAILNYPETVDHKMDGQICRITVTGLTIETNIKKAYHKELVGDYLWQVQVLGVSDRQFLVLQSLLVSLDEDIVIMDETGKLLCGNLTAPTHKKV